jgi:tubulin polyglutamylase TTLL6/13
MALRKHQKINHFPMMRVIAHKVPLAKNMMSMLRAFPSEYRHVPKSFGLPFETKLFRERFNTKGLSKKNKTYILKPDHSCQGKGIVLCRTWDQVVAAMAGIEGGVCAQEYVSDPLLIDGHKFDLRVYVLVLSVDPLRMYLFDDGLVRMCAVKYRKPTSKGIASGFDRTSHLTYYAVNKGHDDFQFNEDGEDILK